MRDSLRVDKPARVSTAKSAEAAPAVRSLSLLLPSSGTETARCRARAERRNTNAAPKAVRHPETGAFSHGRLSQLGADPWRFNHLDAFK